MMTLLSFDEYKNSPPPWLDDPADPANQGLLDAPPDKLKKQTFEPAHSGYPENKWPFVRITPTLKPAPAFNSAMLPSAFVPFVEDAAYRMQAPPDFIAVSLMVSLSAVVGRKFAIHPKQWDNWLVVPNLWGGIVSNPSAKKSPSIAEGIKAIEQLEIGAKNDYMEARKEYAIDAKLAKITEKQGNADAEKALKDGAEDDAKQAARKILASAVQVLEEPKRKRYKTNSATVEKLGELLADNPNGMLIIRYE
ncbi:MAG: DUF3987 domain-containing protein, partial [Thiothrix sp.]|nr:DUF3987 domain-containing protein [Thiothrix sp.]